MKEILNHLRILSPGPAHRMGRKLFLNSQDMLRDPR